MTNNPRWIWPEGPVPRRTYHTVFSDKRGFSFCVAEFKKEIAIADTVKKAVLSLCADTTYRFWFNGVFGGTGPVAPGGDYGSTKPMPKTYYTEYPLQIRQGVNTLLVQVRLGAEVMTESSWGQGGLYAELVLEYGDGSIKRIQADENWEARVCDRWRSSSKYDGTIGDRPWGKAALVDNIWTLARSPIPPLYEEFIQPAGYDIRPEYQNRIRFKGRTIHISRGSPLTFTLRYDRIYSAYASFSYRGSADIHIELKFQEHPGKTDSSERITTGLETNYQGWVLRSVGYLEITLSNFMDRDIELQDLGILFTCYPVTESGSFHCSEEALNKIYEVGKWTLQICRQTLYLDSPIHQETLGCTGDYFIASLINYMTFGDARLTRFDLVRTADWLRINEGRMFHTTYSLIWVQMLADYIRYTADISAAVECYDALELLLELFDSYTDNAGLVDHPPNYMFVDWVSVDGQNLHHPPKALGQAVMNAFYYKALLDADWISRQIQKPNPGYLKRAQQVRYAFAIFWDADRGLYFDGLDTPDSASDWKPENIPKRYFSQHTNALAVLYGLADPERNAGIMKKVLGDPALIQAQPYFMHYVLEALDKAELFETEGLAQIRRWTTLTEECDRGMKEVWFGFDCDYSHVWGATPTYQLPARILGLNIEKPGFQKIRLAPRLMGLDWADVSIPTPYGMIKARLRKGCPPELTIPDAVETVFDTKYVDILKIY